MSTNAPRFEYPTVTDHGSIAAHTFYRCASHTGDPLTAPPKDPEDFPLDKHGECSSGHVSG